MCYFFQTSFSAVGDFYLKTWPQTNIIDLDLKHMGLWVVDWRQLPNQCVSIAFERQQ